MDESKECPYCGDDERPCVCDDMEAHGRAMRARELATARAEAALAEREACAEVVKREAGRRHDALEWMPLGDPRAREIVEARNALDDATSAIRARTTPATLSTETLAAIAEARGLRVVEPGLLAGLEPPVLEWSGDHGTLHETPWSLLLNETDFVIFLSRQIVLRREYADGTAGDVAANRRAAEAALRSLGVAFRVEDGGAK